MNFIWVKIKKSLSYQWLRTSPRFETEAWEDLEMANITVLPRKWRNAKKGSHKTMANQQWFPHHQETAGTVDNNYVY